MRKLIEIDEGTLSALKVLGSDSMKSLQELADEAFADLLEKHGRPVDLRKALKMSAARGRVRQRQSAPGRGRGRQAS